MATFNSWATAKLGFARSMASSIRHGPFALGVAQLEDLWTEQGLAHLILLLLHLLCPHEPNASMLISLSHLRLDAGTAVPILTTGFSTVNCYVVRSWLQHTGSFMHDLDLCLDLPNQWLPQLQRENDLFLMDFFADSTSNTKTHTSILRQANMCCLYIQATTLSDITDGQGLSINQQAWSGNQMTDRSSTYNYLRQDTPRRQHGKLSDDCSSSLCSKTRANENCVDHWDDGSPALLHRNGTRSTHHPATTCTCANSTPAHS